MPRIPIGLTSGLTTGVTTGVTTGRLTTGVSTGRLDDRRGDGRCNGCELRRFGAQRCPGEHARHSRQHEIRRDVRQLQDRRHIQAHANTRRRTNPGAAPSSPSARRGPHADGEKHAAARRFQRDRPKVLTKFAARTWRPDGELQRHRRREVLERGDAATTTSVDGGQGGGQRLHQGHVRR